MPNLPAISVEAIERTLGSAVLSLPEPVLLALAGGPRPPVEGQRLNPQSQMLLRLAALLRPREVWEVPPAEARRDFLRSTRAIAGPRREHVVRDDRRVPGPAGDIPIRVYRPGGVGRRAPLVVYFHGGGWVLGDLDSHDGPCAGLADALRAVVVSVDYRLAPEHRFPAAADDAIAAYRFIASHAADFGGDPSRLAVSGDSAGGNLAAVVAQACRDAGVPPPRAQLLVYPGTDMRRLTPSHRTFGEGYLLTKRSMDYFLDCYVPDEADWLDPKASPLLADDLAGLAPAIVLTAGYDPLRDEGRAYADRLEQAGVPVAYRCHEGLLHGFASMTAVIGAARLAMLEATELLADELRS